MRASLPILVCLMATPLPAHADTVPAGDATRGKGVYEDYCGACHSIDQNRVGPAHRGVYGRKPGKAPGYSYSANMTKQKFVWNDVMLDKWLTNPQELIPGARMGFRLGDPQKRADVIAYLKTQAAPKK